MADRGRIQRLTAGAIVATFLIGSLLLAGVTCYNAATATPGQRKVITFGPAPDPATEWRMPSSETMCFDRLEDSIMKRAEAMNTALRCGDVLKMVLDELMKCEGTKPQMLHVKPTPQALPGKADA